MAIELPIFLWVVILWLVIIVHIYLAKLCNLVSTTRKSIIDAELDREDDHKETQQELNKIKDVLEVISKRINPYE